jgi:hypothetical protein
VKYSFINNFFRIFLLGLVLISVGCNIKDHVPAIAFDADGNPTQVLVPHKEYSKRLMALTSTVQDTAIPVLTQHEGRARWGVRTLSFGIGVNAQIGVGPFSVGAYPRVRLIFSNSTDPTMP